jgi:hypothetical protein
VRLYKTSAIAQLTGRMTPSQVLSTDVGEDDLQLRRNHSERESWQDESLLRDGVFFSTFLDGDLIFLEANSSLPVVRHAVRTERVAADARADRMTIWMRNVESSCRYFFY